MRQQFASPQYSARWREISVAMARWALIIFVRSRLLGQSAAIHGFWTKRQLLEHSGRTLFEHGHSDSIMLGTFKSHKAQINYVPGGIDSPSIKAKVVAILEGTEPVFKNRKRKCGLWNCSYPQVEHVSIVPRVINFLRSLPITGVDFQNALLFKVTVDMSKRIAQNLA